MNVTVRDPNGILTDHAIATYNSIGGDSGAPIIYYHQNGTANLFGSHNGKLCSFSLKSDPHHMDRVVLNDRECNYSHLNMKVFSPWENIKFFLTLK